MSENLSQRYNIVSENAKTTLAELHY